MRPLETLKKANFVKYKAYLRKRIYLQENNKSKPTPFWKMYEKIKECKENDLLKYDVDELFNDTSPYKLEDGQLPNLQTDIAQAKWLQYLTSTDPTNKKKLEIITEGFAESLGSNYGYSRAELIQAYGEYCNYCDIRVPDSALAVEHTVPKSSFPDKMLEWSNFYLACPSCNSNKHNKPNIATLKKLTGVTVGTMTFDQYKKLPQKGVLDNYIWPRSGDNSYKSIDYEITYNKNNIVNNKNLEEFIEHELAINKIYYDYLNNKITNSQGEVIIVKVKGAHNSDKVNRTIDLLDLNKVILSGKFLKLSDRRVFNRTRVATSVVLSILRANEIIAALDYYKIPRDYADHLFTVFIRQLADTIVYSGFFSLCIHMLASNNTIKLGEKDEEYVIGIIKDKYIGTKNDFVT